MATSSSRIHSSSGPGRPSFTLPFKYRRKSWSVDNSDDLPHDIISSPTAPPPLTSDASSSSCSSSPIASSALLSSSNPGSPTDYSHSHIHPYSRDHDQEAWFDTRLSVSYLPFASRVPAVQHKRKQYDRLYTRPPVYATRERTKWMFDHGECAFGYRIYERFESTRSPGPRSVNASLAGSASPVALPQPILRSSLTCVSITPPSLPFPSLFHVHGLPERLASIFSPLSGFL